MLDDQQLLRRYTAEGSETAFRELVERHLNLVYSAALRRVGNDAHLAQDVAQLVFADLARKARSLASNVVLAGWLHRASRYAAAQLMRTNQRRQQREQEAVAMNDLKSESTDWAILRPTLDDALDQLNQTDRDALLLRFFEQHSLAEVGLKLGTNEDAARKRVSRALDKLRAILVRRGLTTTGAALSAVISAHAVQLAPAGLAATLTTASLASAGTSSGITFTALKIMSLTKAQIAIGTAAIALLSASLVVQHHSQSQLREENDSLRRQIAQLNSEKDSLAGRLARSEAFTPRLPAPAIQPVTSSNSMADTMQSTNFYEHLMSKDTKLTDAQVESYLKSSGRSAASLLAAYRTTKDPALLAEAMRTFPNDPGVAFEAALSKDVPPDQRRQWLDTLEKSDPNNALGNYLSALNYFEAGQSDQAIKEMLAAANKSFDDYTPQRYQDDTEAYVAAGYSIADARGASGMQLLLPQLQQVKDLTQDMVNLAKTYQQQGDTASAQAVLQMAIGLGGRYASPTPGEPVISQLVGLAVERNALGKMDPNAPYGSDGQTVQNYRDQVVQEFTSLQQRSDQVGALLPQISEQDYVIYHDRWLMFGEQNAGQWLINKYAQN
jgi:RNA polymerase sigma factor (sigma-70 family)